MTYKELEEKAKNPDELQKAILALMLGDTYRFIPRIDLNKKDLIREQIEKAKSHIKQYERVLNDNANI